MLSAGNISWLYLVFGILASAFVSVFSHRFKVIEEKSELLYLSFGFYRHFFKIYFGNFFSGIKLIIKMALGNQDEKPSVFIVEFKNTIHLNAGLLMASYNMTSGLFCIGHKDEVLYIHAINDAYFRKFDLQKTISVLENVNDDNLV